MWHTTITLLDSQAEDYSTEAGTEHYLDRSPRLPRQNIQVTCESYARQQIREEYVNGRCYNKLVKDSPVRHIASTKVIKVLTKEAERPDRLGSMH